LPRHGGKGKSAGRPFLIGTLSGESETIANAIRQAEIPQQVLQDPDAIGRLNQIFEADARLFQSYRWVERPPAPFPITVFGGQTDPVTSEDDLLQWQHCTRGDFAVRMVPGGHLFIKQSGQLVLQSIHEAVRVH
jgi:surfactin synthase thioesterase subunit